jgi:ferredoxin
MRNLFDSSFPLPKLIRPSTRAFYSEWKEMKERSWSGLLHGYVYMRWPYLYIGLGTGEHPLSGALRRIGAVLKAFHPAQSEGDEPPPTFAEGYHGKVVTTGSARQLVSVREEIEIRDLEKIIPFERARDIILRNPDHIVVLECPCRTAREDPCLPLDVCIIVGEPFSSLVVEHHPGRARWIPREEAEEILVAEHERGHVHHAFFKDAMLERFYAICNCCSCCCGAMQSFRNGTPMLESSGYVSELDPMLCGGCEACADVCPFSAISIIGSTPEINEQKCMGCGVCISHCTLDALHLRRESSKSEPLELFALVEGLPM